MPDPEQFEHLSVFGGDRGWFPPLTEDTGSIRTSDPVFEQRAHARYPDSKSIIHMSTFLQLASTDRWLESPFGWQNAPQTMKAEW